MKVSVLTATYNRAELLKNLYNSILKNINDVHIPETKVDMETYTTLQVEAENAVKQYLNYPDLAGNLMIDDAIKLAKEKYNINFSDTNNEYFV